jgi:hypothetical protein
MRTIIILVCAVALTGCAGFQTAPDAPPKVAAALAETRQTVKDDIAIIRALDDAGCNVKEYEKLRRGEMRVSCK